MKTEGVRLQNPEEAPVRLHNPSKPKRQGSRSRNPAGFKPELMSIALPIVAGGFLATFIVQGKQWIQAKTGWDQRAMAWAQLAAVFAGAYGMMWALKQPWGRKNRVEVLVGGTALLTPLAVDAAATLMPESGAGTTTASSTDATGRRHYRGSAAWLDQSRAPRQDHGALTTDVEFGGMTTGVEFGAIRPRRQYN